MRAEHSARNTISNSSKRVRLKARSGRRRTHAATVLYVCRSYGLEGKTRKTEFWKRKPLICSPSAARAQRRQDTPKNAAGARWQRVASCNVPGTHRGSKCEAGLGAKPQALRTRDENENGGRRDGECGSWGFRAA